MIDKADERMVAWVQSIAGSVNVVLEFPQAAVATSSVSVYLMEVLPTPAMRLAREPEPLKLTLRYLVTSCGGSPEEAHRILGQLILAALATPKMEVEAEPVPPSVWQSFGQAVRPSFVVRVPLVQERPAKFAPKVRQPIVIKNSPLQPLFGQVLGPGNIGIMDASVEVPALNLCTRTDAQGRVYFAALPTEPPIQLLRVHAKGRDIDVSPVRRPEPNQPLLINLNESQL